MQQAGVPNAQKAVQFCSHCRRPSHRQLARLSSPRCQPQQQPTAVTTMAAGTRAVTGAVTAMPRRHPPNLALVSQIVICLSKSASEGSCHTPAPMPSLE